MSLIDCLEKISNICFAIIPRKKPSSLKSHIEAVKIIAHRGAHTTTPNKIIENTHAAFERALELGCWGIEFDVHATKDGIIVVNHDPTLDRLWNVKASISQLTFKELHHRAPLIPTLAEVVERYGKRLHLFVELKVYIDENALLATLAPLSPEVDYHLLSLDESIFSPLKQFAKTTMLLVPVHNNVTKFCNLSLEKKYGGILGHYLLLTKSKKQRLEAANQRIGVGIVDSKFCLYREIDRGHDWIFTNDVLKINQSLQELKAGFEKPSRNGGTEAGH
jgi:glycerophosphoryl diester phosphodiesterase